MSQSEVSIATFSSETEALMLREALENEGIPSVLVPLASGAGGLGATVWRPFELRVRSTDVKRARELIELLRDET
jgi:hypothetical protein